MTQLTDQQLKRFSSYAEKLAKRYANKLSFRITYEDLLSAGYEAIARCNHKNKGEPNPGYYWKAIKNSIMNEIRKLSNDKSWIVDTVENEQMNIVDTIADESDIEDEIALQALSIHVRRQIDKLKPAERDYAVLTLIEGCATKEIAKKRCYTRQRVSQLKKVVEQKLQRWNSQYRVAC
jgi:RNA polymerase sigma factor (sigma-70 family)